jgi:hypothetical protein
MHLPFRSKKPEPSPTFHEEEKPSVFRARIPPPPSAREKVERAEARTEEIRQERDALAGRLERLEAMLADPEAGQNAILYFRLRAIWELSCRKLETMAMRFREKYEARNEEGVENLPRDKRRAINILLIALAQEYYLFYHENQIAEMTRLAALKSVEDVHFGLADECLEFGRKARELVARTRGESRLGDALRRRAKYLHGSLRFSEEGNVPLAESMNSFPINVAEAGDSLNDHSESIPVNVLALNYWGLKAALLR